MTTTALVLTVLVSLVGMGFLVRWEIRRQERRRNAQAFQEALVRMTTEIEQLSARIGEAFVPAVRRATAAVAAFGEALAKIPQEDLR